MCTTCGCGEHNHTHMHAHVDENGNVTTHVAHDHDHEHRHDHANGHHHDQDHGPAHSHAPTTSASRAISIEEDILGRNNAIAAVNRKFFREHRVLALNLVSSPGSGKTELLAQTLKRASGFRTAVIEGDQQTANDAERISDIAVKIYRKTARIQRQGLSEDLLAATSDIIARLRAFAHETTHVLRKGGTLKRAPAVAEDTITRAAKALSRQYSETLANAAGDRPHDTAFLTVLAGIRDVNRHIGNIAERVPALG